MNTNVLVWHGVVFFLWVVFFFILGGGGGVCLVLPCFFCLKKKSAIMPTDVSEKTDLNGAGSGLCFFPV